MEPTTKRRSRMCRASTGKTIELTDRDLAIFKLLERYRYLRSTFLYAFVGGASENRFKERLGHLYHEGGYLNRPEQQWQYANARYMPVIYENGDKAEEVLRRHGLLGEEATSWLRRGRMGAHHHFAHALMICDILASIELGVRADASLRFISWQEIVARAPEQTRRAENPFQIPVSICHNHPGAGEIRADIKLVPDGLFGLEYARGGERAYRFFALEADRNTVPVSRSDLAQSSYLKKILGYREVAARQIYRSHFGLPNLFVLNVTTSERHMKNIMTLLEEITGGSTLFLIKTISSIGDFRRAPAPTPHILTEPWLRVGHEPFLLCQ